MKKEIFAHYNNGGYACGFYLKSMVKRAKKTNNFKKVEKTEIKEWLI